MKRVIKKLTDFLTPPQIQAEKDNLEREILDIKKLRKRKLELETK